MLPCHYLHNSAEVGAHKMNGDYKKGLVIGIASLLVGIGLGDLIGNEKHRETVYSAVNDGYVAIKGFVKPEK
jgi:hypothetical protein